MSKGGASEAVYPLSERDVTVPLARYPSYSQSGLDWLSQIPEHWDCTVVKRVFDVQLGKMLQTSPAGPTDTKEPYLRAANIQWDGVDTSDVKEMWLSSEDREKYSLEGGDLLVSEGGDVGRCAIWDGEFECYYQNALNRLRPRFSVSPKFGKYWFRFLKDSGFVDMLCSKATISHYTAEKVKNSPIFLPPEEDRDAIVSFLSHKTENIDRLIAKKERLIELLEERRTALITKAVTKGLDSEVPMKDSGVEWLGEIPEHWEVRRPKHLCYVENSGIWGEESGECDDPTPVLRTADLDKSGRVDYASIESRCLTPSEESRYRCREGDIVVVKSSGSATNIISGKATLIGPEEAGMAFSNFMLRLRPRSSRVNPAFLFRVLTSQLTRERIHRMVSTTTYPNLDVPEYVGFSIPYPPLSEQEEIATHLASQEQLIWTLQHKVRDAIESLREHRSALIAAAVTGKIDVRDQAA